MTKYLILGEINKFNKYILYLVLFQFIYNCLYGLQYNKSFTEIKIIPSTKLSKHLYFHQFFYYLGTFIISLFIYKYKKSENTLSAKINADLHSKKNYLVIVILFFALLCEDVLSQFYKYALKDLDFWMLELLIITYFTKRILLIRCYRHQMFAIGINSITCILKIFTIILSNINNDKNEVPILYIKYKSLIPLGILVYLSLLSIESYIYLKIKWFIDKRYFDPNLLLTIYGGIGTIFYIFMR